MNPAYNKTLNLLVENKQGPQSKHRSNRRPKQPTLDATASTAKPRTTAALREPSTTNITAQQMFGGAKPSYSLSTDDTSAEKRIPPPLKRQDPKKTPLYKRILGAFMKKFGRSSDT